jgi:arylsulfatase A-like enzyme
MEHQRRPNILWIQTDEQRTDSLGCYGHPKMNTPNIDKLAKRGTVFSNHHVQSPICVPSRVSQLTSCYPHQTGILNNSVHYNHGKWPEGLIAFPELFASEGYVTANFGKYHTPHHSTWLENWHFELFADEADFLGLPPEYDEMEHRVIHKGHNEGEVILSGKYPNVKGGRTPTSHVTDLAIDWLRQFQHVRRPFFLRVSYLAPHTPVLVPESHYEMYDLDDMDWDAPSEDVLASRPRFEREGNPSEDYSSHTAEEFRRMRSSYYGLVSHIDEQIGRLMKELEESGELDNTVIVFNSDHGTLMGEYGLFQKGVFYDLVTRVPCIIAIPGKEGGKTIADLTESIDLGPTLLALAGIPAIDQMKGRNMLDEDSSRDAVIGEVCLQRSGKFIRRSWIRTERWSMDFTSEIDGVMTDTAAMHDGKLTDIRNDPLERRNLYYDPDYAQVVEELTEKFRARTTTGRRPMQYGLST